MSELLSYSSVLLFVSPVVALTLRNSQQLAVICALVTAGLLFVPINEASLILQLRGVFADLSLTTIVLLTTLPLLKIIDKFSNGSSITTDIAWLCVVVLTLAIALYPMALGAGAYDTYALGYQPLALLTLATALGFIAVLNRYWISTATVILALTSYWMRALPSQNFWDYLLDPITVILAVSYLALYLFRSQKWHRLRDTPHSA